MRLPWPLWALGAGFVALLSASAAAQNSALIKWWNGGAYYDAPVDNNPGNGAAAWLWAADYTTNDGYGAAVHVYYTDGSYQAWGPTENGTATARLPKDASRFQICNWFQGMHYACSAWKYL